MTTPPKSTCCGECWHIPTHEDHKNNIYNGYCFNATCKCHTQSTDGYKVTKAEIYSNGEGGSCDTQSTELEMIVEEFNRKFPPFMSEYPDAFTTQFEMSKDNRKQIIDWIIKHFPAYAQTKVNEALRGYRRDLLDVLEPYREYKEIEEVYQVIKGTPTTK